MGGATGGTSDAARITVLLLDADGVFQWPTPGFEQAFEELRLGFAQEVFAFELEYLRGRADFVTDFTAWAREHGATDATIAAMLEAFRAIDVDPEALKVIADVRDAGTPVHMATNQQHFRGAHMQDTLGYEEVFDGHFYSFELGHAKPDPAYFEAILGRLKVPAEQVLFVDDRPENVEGAASCGIKAEVHTWEQGAGHLRELFTRYGLLRG